MRAGGRLPKRAIPLILVAGCREPSLSPVEPPEAGPTAPRIASVPLVEKPVPEPVRVAELEPGRRPPTYVLRGARGTRNIVFLHGLCGHAQGYVQAFQNAAAEHGVVVAPQGDVQCGKGPFSTWSGDVAGIDRRITSAFASLGISAPSDVTVIGYSLGASMAQALARRWPERYTRLILIAAPAAPSSYGFKDLRSTVMMSGSRDRKDLMRAGAARMQRAGVPCTFMELPGASHGQMGSDPERVMGEALAWLFEHERAGIR